MACFQSQRYVVYKYKNWNPRGLRTRDLDAWLGGEESARVSTLMGDYARLDRYERRARTHRRKARRALDAARGGLK